ncbi:hypothetical protein FS837_009868 [Tulasnella sp. UAMH 9824]|nr:hypothetical protein FS837_009868 [Tulasnella sp. UAMH 9824]
MLSCNPIPVTQVKEMGIDKDSEDAVKKLPPKRGPIDLLPEEILINIIRLSIKSETPVLDLVKITAVCRRWKWILEGAPKLWTSITAAEGLGALRKALRLVQDAPLDVKFQKSTSKVDIETFFREMTSKISQWKALIVESNDGSPVVSSTCPAPTAPPRLELLHIICSYNSPPQTNREIALFGREPAPASLRDVRLERAPVAVTSLQFSGLTSLVLVNQAHIPQGELIRILKESPALEQLRLSWWGDPASPLEESAHPATSHDASICLTSLRSLVIESDPPHVRLLLSTLRFPNLETFHLGGVVQRSPVSDYFTIDTGHLVQACRRITLSPGQIRIIVEEVSCVASISHSFSIRWAAFPIHLDRIRELFEWLFTHLGEHLKGIPTTLSLRGCANHLPWIEWVSSNLKVTSLTLHGDRSHAGDPNTVVPLLSNPVSVGLATALPQWLFPYLEVFSSTCATPMDVTIIAGMIQERHLAIGNQDMPGIIPKPFRKIRLAYGGPMALVKDLRINEEALKTIKRESRGAEVYWAGAEWTST